MDPELQFETATAWRDWLEANHSSSAGVWLPIGKRGKAVPLISIEQAGEVALCYGWIDSHRKGRDASSFLQRYSPRSAKSPWSLKNRTLAERLMANGLMTPFGLEEIAYAGQRDFQIPEEFLELAKSDEAVLERLSRSELYLLLLPALKIVDPLERRARYSSTLPNSSRA